MKITEGTVVIAALILFAAWLFIGLPIYLGSSERTQYYDDAQGTPASSASEPKGTADAPFFVQVIPAPKSAAERTQEAQDREEKRASDRWLVRWTAALFAATVGLILATGILGYFAWRQGRDTERALVSTERAFVFPGHYELVRANEADDESPFLFTVGWKNGGKTWTRRGLNYASWMAIPPGDNPPDDFPNLGIEHAQFAPFVIGPGAIIISHRLEIPHRFFGPAMQGQCQLYAWGWCEYNDIFPGTTRHRTEFCVKIDPVSDAPAQDGKRRVLIQFAHYHKHNGADDDCLKPAQT